VKDIYDYPTSTSFTRLQGSNLVPILVYLNGHFARSKGFEVEVEKRRGTGYWAGKLAYTYQQTKGKSSDPNEAKVAQLNEFSAAETRLSETFVSWNRPHKLTASLDLRFTDRTPSGLGWLKGAGFNWYVQGQSGRPYTPIFGPASTQVAEPNSRNGPFQVVVDLKANRAFRLWGQRLDVAGRNIFNNPIVNRVDRVTGQGRAWGVGEYDASAGFQVTEYTRVAQVEDPSNFGPKAQWRMSLDLDF
jgi:hypothetical protein